jgi:hypothetical protein
MMNRRKFLELSTYLLGSSFLSGCGYLRIDPFNVLLRSDVIDSPEKEKEILSKARVTKTADGQIRVLYLSGTPYERGYQHGVLLRKEVKDNIGTMYENILDKFHFEELLHESWERQRPFVPQEYIDEMHGLAHGAKIPLKMVHGFHALPEITEWGGKKKLKKVIKDMMAGVYGTSCSNFAAMGPATKDGTMYTLRILDWGLHRISNLHEYPLITVSVPEHGIPSANIGWVGFVGAVSGMNAEGITLGEMGYGDPEGETMRGKPMPFMLRDVLSYAHNLPEVRKVISESIGTNAFVFLMSDGKNNTAELYIRERNRFEVYTPGVELKDDKRTFPAINNIVYGGHYDEKMHTSLSNARGSITPDVIMKEIVPAIAMPSNFQNVVYDPRALQFWVNNAKNSDVSAAEQPFTHFDLGAALKDFGHR